MADRAAGRPPAIFLMGPTATGKTDLAVALSQRLSVEIISVDSAMVYRGMDIGTAKPGADTLAAAPHHLVDIRDPSEPYSAADFAADTAALMAGIADRGKIPLLVGGTMLYFRVLEEGLADLPAADPEVREAILREARTSGWPALHRQLARVDPDSAAAIHPNHSQRIQRALEIYRLAGRPVSTLKREQREAGTGIDPLVDHYAVTRLALLPHRRELLHDRIAQRFRAMLDAGLIDEVRALRGRGDLGPELPALRAVGYRQVWDYLDGRVDYNEMVQKGIAATRQLAKRQLTWLRRWPGKTALFIDDEEGNPSEFQQIFTNCLKNLQNGPIYS